ncbi:MAG TPA: nucleotidyltransferase domain-containing protein [Candidatus Kapabacteria bacterium]|nr:nucleotidyltransferase domain-containing protein [Candidatus Kapabacteria bacterium]HPO63359.1 nucleotidyltransferase domain-containing protein [Candidatus Kapabacteria bacterium]
MDKEIDNIIQKFIVKTLNILSPEEIILYGSYAKGNNKEDSDIDIAVILNTFYGDYLDYSAKLFNISYQIDYRIEPVLLINNYDKSGFIEHIKSYGKQVYCSKQ